jgi:hypothetical protein
MAKPGTLIVDGHALSRQRLVVVRWGQGDLAAAVRELDIAIAKAKRCGA